MSAGFTLADQVAALVGHGGPGVVDGVLVNSRPLPERVLARYRAAGSSPTRLDFDRAAQWGVWIHEADVAALGEKVRHHPGRLGRALLDLVAKEKGKEP